MKQLAKCINSFSYPSLTEWKVYEGELDWQGNIFVSDDVELWRAYPIDLFELQSVNALQELYDEVSSIEREMEDFEEEINDLEEEINDLERNLSRKERELESVQRKIKALGG